MHKVAREGRHGIIVPVRIRADRVITLGLNAGTRLVAASSSPSSASSSPSVVSVVSVVVSTSQSSAPDFIGIFFVVCSHLVKHKDKHTLTHRALVISSAARGRSVRRLRPKSRTHTHARTRGPHQRIGAEWVWKDRLMYVCRPIFLLLVTLCRLHRFVVCLFVKLCRSIAFKINHLSFVFARARVRVCAPR